MLAIRRMFPIAVLLIARALGQTASASDKEQTWSFSQSSKAALIQQALS